MRCEHQTVGGLRGAPSRRVRRRQLLAPPQHPNEAARLTRERGDRRWSACARRRAADRARGTRLGDCTCWGRRGARRHGLTAVCTRGGVWPDLRHTYCYKLWPGAWRYEKSFERVPSIGIVRARAVASQSLLNRCGCSRDAALAGLVSVCGYCGWLHFGGLVCPRAARPPLWPLCRPPLCATLYSLSALSATHHAVSATLLMPGNTERPWSMRVPPLHLLPSFPFSPCLQWACVAAADTTKRPHACGRGAHMRAAATWA